jgi:apolipoprotein N-acyltransferase
MDTLIFIGLLAVVFGIATDRSRRVVLLGWFAVIAATILLLSWHITSSLGLGLNW